jgi:hypothetical protein
MFNTGNKKRKQLSGKGVFNIKHAALVRLHARSLLKANEVITLVRGGYDSFITATKR